MEIREENIDQLLQARSEIDEELRRHKTKLTVLFTDIVGSTTYFDRFGDTAGLLLLHRHDSLVMGAVEEFRGTVVKTIGDSVMADFTDPLPAVRAAIAIQQRLLQHNQSLARNEQLQIRIGVHTGLGFRRGNDLFGDAVNVAARITKRSGSAQILVSQSVVEVMPAGEVTCKTLGKVNLEGKAEAEELFEVVWTDASGYESLRASLETVPAPADGSSPGGKLDEFVRRTPTLSAFAGISPQAPLPQSLLGRYDVLNRLGAGGMGVVYKALDRETGEIVALKVLKTEIADQAPLMEVFKNELRVARKITHKNVCRIYDFNRTDGTAFISMEFIEGESLRRVLDRFNALTTRKGIKVARQICDALREAHVQGIVHRDLKPENLMIDESGNVKLMDFGLAHLVTEGSPVAVGTPCYMAPEQAQGKPVDQRADIYALGLVMFEIFTGSAAFTGDTPIAVALKQLYDVPPNPRDVDHTIPEHIAGAILRCLEKEPGKRFQSVDELQAVLNDVSDSRNEASPLLASAGRFPERVVGVWRTSPGVASAAVAVVLVICLLIGAAMFSDPAGAKEPSPQVSPATFAELSAFRMAQTLDTEDAWNAFLKDHREGPLSADAQKRIQVIRARSAEKENATPVPTPVVSPAVPETQPDVKQAVISRPGWMDLLETAPIPAGVFMMGNDNGRGDEKPRHQVRVDAFNMSRTEISNRQYLAFLEETGYPRPKDPGFAKNYFMAYPDYPVVNVSYEDAIAFCTWASAKFEATVRLPTEAEWEYAALAGTDSTMYPWGAQDPGTMARFKGNAPREPATVARGAFPSNGFGLYNMSGNVWEWVLDFYSKDYYSTSPIRNPGGPTTGTRRSVRGGSWANDETALGVTRRANRSSGERSDQIGFRVVVARSKPPTSS